MDGSLTALAAEYPSSSMTVGTVYVNLFSVRGWSGSELVAQKHYP
jgi:hypothetical protein